jgi:hypothetical protein
VPRLSERLSALSEGAGRLWFPGIAQELVANFWLDRGGSFGPTNYSSEGWLRGVPQVRDAGSDQVEFGSYASTVEILSDDRKGTFSGLIFDPHDHARPVTALQAAANLLRSIDESLPETVGSLVRSIHVLQAPRDHDTSHSTPDLPFSVFVSVPAADESDAVPRLAESLLHEAMHLQLTLIERIEPIVSGDEHRAYSPWKEESRPVRGLLHGLYVFAVVHQLLGRLAERGSPWTGYCAKRQAQIEVEVASLIQEPAGLYPLGRTIWLRGLAVVLAS